MTDNNEFLTRDASGADDPEVELLRAEMQAAGLLPALPSRLEPTPASAAAMLARVRQMAALENTQTTNNLEPVVEAGPFETALETTPTTNNPNSVVELVETTQQTTSTPAATPVVQTRKPVRAHQGLFALAASILLATAVAIPMLDRATHPSEVVAADAAIETLDMRVVPIEPQTIVDGVAVPAEETNVGWTAEPGRLSVVTWGSSSCPTRAEPTAAAEGDALRITLVEPPLGATCTADMTATTSLVSVPDGFDNGQPLTVLIDHQQAIVEPRPASGEPGPRATFNSGE